MKRWLLCAFVALASTGCFRTTVRAGAPPGSSPAGYHERWHSGWVGGLVEGSGPHHLDELCPDGWAQIDTKTQPVDLAVIVVTIFIYVPQVVTISCRDPRKPKQELAKTPPSASYPVEDSSGSPPPASLEQH